MMKPRSLLPSLLSLAIAMRAFADAPTNWPRATPAAAALDVAKLAAMEAAARAGKFPKLGSVAIARGGKLVYEAYFDGDAATLRDTRSATKSITGALAGIAVDQGALAGVDAKILPLLGADGRALQNGDARKAQISVEDLLTMSGVLECDDWNDFSRGNEERMYLVEDWTRFILDLPVAGRSSIGEPQKSEHKFSYCTGGVFVLGDILARVTHERLDRFAARTLFAPLGIDRVAWVFSPLGVASGGGGLRLTTRDILKIAQLYLDGGTWQGKRIVDGKWIARSIAKHQTIDGDTGYGYLWWLKSFAGERAFFMSGNGGNKVLGFPSLGVAVAITSTNYNTRGMHDVTEKLLVDWILPSLKR
jgi:CubicO group peptidase (beta-lactamase class C family)